MPTKPTRLFTLLFATVTLLEMLGDTLAIRWLHYGCKPLIMGLLLGYVWQHYREKIHPGPIRWLLVGMVFALLGDVFLMIQEVDLFAPGLVAFLVMQLCYSRAFWLSIRQQGNPPTAGLFVRTAFPFILYLLGFLYILQPAFMTNPSLTLLWWPVVLYAFCLNMMGLLAVQRRGLPDYIQVIIGALLFILSDSLIAIDKFLHPISGATWFIMSTYAIAQYLIVVGMTQESK
jgi:uncharacterized membrane protein YhhN